MSTDTHAIVARRRALRELSTQVTTLQSHVTQILNLIVEATASPEESEASAVRLSIEKTSCQEALASIHMLRTALVNSRVVRPLTTIAHSAAATPATPQSNVATGISPSVSIFPLMLQTHEPSIPSPSTGLAADSLKLAQGVLDDAIDDDVPLEQQITPLPQTLSALERVQASMLRGTGNTTSHAGTSTAASGNNVQQRQVVTSANSAEDPFLCGVDASTGFAIPAALAAIEPSKLPSWRTLLGYMHVKATRASRHLRSLVSQSFPHLSLTTAEARYALSERSAYRDDSGDLIRSLIPKSQDEESLDAQKGSPDLFPAKDNTSTLACAFEAISQAYLRRAEQRVVASRALGVALNAMPSKSVTAKDLFTPFKSTTSKREPRHKLLKLYALGESMCTSRTDVSVSSAVFAEDVDDLISALSRTGGTGAGGSGMRDPLGRGSSGFTLLFGKVVVPMRNIHAAVASFGSSPNAIIFEVPYTLNLVLTLSPDPQNESDLQNKVGDISNVGVYALTESISAMISSGTMIPSVFASMRTATQHAKALLFYLKSLPSSQRITQQHPHSKLKSAFQVIEELAVSSSLPSTRFGIPSESDVRSSVPWLYAVKNDRILQICLLMATWARLAYGNLFTNPYSSLDPYSTLIPSPYSAIALHTRSFPRTNLGSAPGAAGNALFSLEYSENPVDFSSDLNITTGGRRMLLYATKLLDRTLGSGMMSSTVSISPISPLTSRLIPVTTTEAPSYQAKHLMTAIAQASSASVPLNVSTQEVQRTRKVHLESLSALLSMFASTSGEALTTPATGTGFATTPCYSHTDFLKHLEPFETVRIQKLCDLAEKLRRFRQKHTSLGDLPFIQGILAVEHVAKSLGVTLDGLVYLILLA